MRPSLDDDDEEASRLVVEVSFVVGDSGNGEGGVHRIPVWEK